MTAPAAPTSGSAKPDAIFFQSDYQVPTIHEVDFAVEREIARNTMVSASYLASFGRDLPVFLDTNFVPPTSTITYAVKGGLLNGQSFTVPAFTGARPNANFGRITQITSGVTSDYNALVLQANRRMTSGLQFQASYTYAKSADDGQSSQTFTSGDNVLNPFNVKGEYGRSNFDTRHRVVTSIVWTPEVKFGNSLVQRILNGYTFSPIWQYATGFPYTATLSGNAPGGTSTGILGAGGTNRVPIEGRNVFHSDPRQVMDFRISRQFGLTERMKVQILAEAFNLFNHVNPTSISTRQYIICTSTTASGCSAATGATAAAPALAADPAFGSVTQAGATLYNSRQIQLGARFTF